MSDGGSPGCEGIGEMPDPNDASTVTDLVTSVFSDSDGSPAPQSEPQEPVAQEPESQPASDDKPVSDAQTPGIEPLEARLRAAGVRPQDIEQVKRYYGYRDENAKLQKERDELKGRDPWKVQADQYISSITDPEMREQHERYRAYHGDRKYLVDLERQQSQPEPDVQPQPDADATPEEQLRKELEELKQWKQAQEAREKEQRFKSMVDQEFTTLKVPDYMHTKLFEVCKARAIEHLRAGRYNIRVADLVKQEWDSWSEILNHQAQQKLESARQVATPAPTPKPTQPGTRVNPPDLDEETTVRGLVSKGVKAAIDASGDDSA